MADWTLPMNGGCRCGKVRFTITAPPMFTSVCHCTGCQRMTGGAYSTSLAVPSAQFALTAGETVIGGMHADGLRHRHCDWCKSWVFTVFEPDTGFANVRATMLDDTSWFTPFIEMGTAEALPWARVAAPHTYAMFPPESDYGKLLGGFGAR
jgi:hypothetical protein